MSSVSLDTIFKAYDIRGTVPDQLDADIARAIGSAFARFAARTSRARRARHARVGTRARDRVRRRSASRGRRRGPPRSRVHRPDLLRRRAASTRPERCSPPRTTRPRTTASSSASSGARPVGVESGLAEIKATAEALLAEGDGGPLRAERRSVDLLDDFADHVHSFIDIGALRPLKVVADTANGMGGLVVPAVFEQLPIELEIMYGELDGTFPNHPADPIQPENQRDLRARVRATRRRRRPRLRRRRRPCLPRRRAGPGPLRLDDHRDAGRRGPRRSSRARTILHNLICSKAVPEVIREHGGEPIRHTRRSLVHQAGDGRDRRGVRRRALGALLLPRQLPGRLRDHRHHVRARADVADRPCRCRSCACRSSATQTRERSTPRWPTRTRRSRASRPHYAGANQDRLDGLTVDFGDWWFNLRPSNTEPLLRLNLEAATRDDCDTHVAEVLALVTGG